MRKNMGESMSFLRIPCSPQHTVLHIPPLPSTVMRNHSIPSKLNIEGPPATTANKLFHSGGGRVHDIPPPSDHTPETPSTSHCVGSHSFPQLNDTAGDPSLGEGIGRGEFSLARLKGGLELIGLGSGRNQRNTLSQDQKKSDEHGAYCAI